MKKIYIALLFSIPFLVTGQTITQADLPHAGTAFTMGNDTTFNAPVPAGGMSQVWDYSGLLNHRTDTTGFISAAGTLYASLFPSSNLCSIDQVSGGYSYYTSNSTGLYIDGFGNGSTNIIFNPSELFIPVPFSFGGSTSNTAIFQIDTTVVDTSGTLHLRIVHRVDSQISGDASGSLTTPTAVYPSVLRIKSIELTYDSIYIDPTGLGFYIPFSGSASQVTNYHFVTSGNTVNYIMGLNADSLGTTATSAQYLIDNALSVPSVIDNKSIVVYPNPVMNSVNFKFLNENSSIVIYDSNGKEAYRSAEIFGKNINVETLPNGVYHYEIIQKGKSQKGSFVIQH